VPKGNPPLSLGPLSSLKQAVNDGLVPRNVTEAVKAPRQTRKEIQALSPEQARAFLETASGGRLETLYLLAIHTGLRQSSVARASSELKRRRRGNEKSPRNRTNIVEAGN
jgi:integrase